VSENWDKVYSKRFGGTWSPNEGVVRFTARYLRRRVGINVYDTRRRVGKILDTGCGNGRHVLFFAEQGFDVYGLDISKEAVEIARGWLNSRSLKAHLEIGSITRLPFEDNFFDVVVSCEVLDHVKFAEAKEAMQEIRRVSTQGAYFYVTLRSTRDSECGRGQEVEKNTFVLQEGYEKGFMQHFFELEEIKELLEGFKIFDIECHEQLFPQVYSVDKAFLQSSRGQKKFIDVSSPLDLNLKYSRWHIAAEKV